MLYSIIDLRYIITYIIYIFIINSVMFIFQFNMLINQKKNNGIVQVWLQSSRDFKILNVNKKEYKTNLINEFNI